MSGILRYGYVYVKLTTDSLEAPEIKLVASTGEEGNNGWYTSEEDGETVKVTATIENPNSTGTIKYILSGVGATNEEGEEDNGTYTYTEALTIKESGLTKVIAWVEDSNGYTSEYSYKNVKIDNSIPTVSLKITSPDEIDGENGWYTSDVVVKITGEDTGSGIYGYVYTIVNNTTGKTVASNVEVTGESKEITFKTDGEYEITVYAKDRAGNKSATVTKTIYKDSTAPSSFVPTVDTDTLTDTSFNVLATTTDAVSGVSYYEYYIKEANSSGSYELKESTSDTSYTFEDLTGSTAYSVYVVAVDKAGNKETSSVITVKTTEEVQEVDLTVDIDVTEKTEESITIDITVTNEDGEEVDNPTIEITIKDSDGNDITDDVEITKNKDGTYTISGLEDGTEYKITVEATDEEGNTGEETITVKTEIPEATSSNISFLPDPNDWTNEDVTVTATTTTKYYVQISKDGSNWTGGTTSSASTEVDTYGTTVYARLYDGTDSGDYMTYTVINIDKTNPVATVTTSTTNSITFTGTDTISGIVEYAVTTSSTEEPQTWTSITATTSLTSTTVPNLTQGTTYYVWLQDQAGNTNSDTVSDTATTTGEVPSGADETDEEGKVTKEGAIQFSGVTWTNGYASTTISTTESSYYIQYQVVSSTGTLDTSDSAWTTVTTKGQSVTVSNLYNKDTVYARLWDGTNSGDYASLTILDNTAPTVEITEKETTTNSVTFTGTDNESGIVAYAVTTSSTAPADGWTEVTATNSLGETTVGSLSDGTDYYVWLKDVAGNTGYEKFTTEAIDDVEIEQSLVGKYVAYTPDSGNSYDLTASTYTGNTSNSKVFTTDKTLNWQIWSITDDELILIADDTAQSGGYYNSSATYGYTLYLSGLLGYTNGVNLLNDICETLYSNSELGATARSLNIQDIEDVLDWDYWNPTEYYYSSTYPCYDSSITLQYTSSSYRYYPDLWAEEDFANIDGTTVNEASYTYNSSTGTKTYTGSALRRSDNISTLRTSATRKQAGTSIEVTDTYWGGSSYATSSGSFIDDKYLDVLYIGKYYWLASRYVFPGSFGAYFGLQLVSSSGYVGCNYLVYSNSSSTGDYFRGVRPVVSIPLDTLTLNTWDYSGDTADDAYTLVAKTEENLSGGVTGLFSSSDQVEFSEVTWEDEMASITLTSTNSDLYIQYQVVGEDGTYSDDDWTTSDNKGTVDLTNLNVNDTIYVRLYDGTNYGGYGSFNIIDYIGPTVTMTLDIYATSVKVTVDSAVDYQSGMPDEPTYIYQYRDKGSTTWYTAAETTATEYTILGLDTETDYTIRVRVADNGGAYGAATEDITTES